jgi:hypothetical protein
MRLLLLFLALLGGLSRSNAAEPMHAHAQTGQGELGAAAAFDATGTVWAVHKVSGHLAVSRSTDAGRTWGNPVLVTPAPEATDTGGDARPKLAVGPQGQVYVTWTRPLAKPYTGEVRFSRSLDGGRTFSVPVVVHRDRQEITHRFDALAVNARGQVFVAWIDKRDQVAAGKAGGYRGAAVYFAVSDDAGATFRGDFKAADHCCECCRLALQPDAEGGVVALWRHVFAPNVRDHALVLLRPDGTAGPLRRVTFDDWRIDVCPHHGPALGLGADGVRHAVWFSGAPGKAGVFLGRLGENGVEQVQAVGGLTAEHADAAAAGSRVLVAWKEFDGERTRLRARLSADGGRTWMDRELGATEGPSDHPRVLTSPQGLHVLWNSRNEPLRLFTIP